MPTLLQNRQLSGMLTALRAECGHSTAVAAGLNDRDSLLYLLNRVQVDLWEDYDWPDLRVDRDIQLADGVRYYPYPADLRLEDVDHVWVWGAANTVYELKYDITPVQYLLWNSEDGAKSWPPQRWQHNADTNAIELWPIPDATAAGAKLRLRGTRTPQELINDSDTPLLPWRVIVLTAAAEVLARQEDPSAQAKAQRAQEILRRRKVRLSAHKSNTIALAGGHTRMTGNTLPRAGLDYIPSGYGSGPRRS